MAGALPLGNRDPFDRMLIAQALRERLRLVSNETGFDAAGVVRVWCGKPRPALPFAPPCAT
jgi:PIN domain nuclease of toxin-antitoxin system